MKFRTKENLSTASQLTKNWTPKDLRHENTLQYTDNQATTKLILRAKEQEIKAVMLLKDKDYNRITAGFASSAAYKGQSQAANTKNLPSRCFQPCQMNSSSWNSPCYTSASGWIVLFKHQRDFFWVPSLKTTRTMFPKALNSNSILYTKLLQKAEDKSCILTALY